MYKFVFFVDAPVEILKDGRELKLERLHEEWISYMPDNHDEEMATGNDEPTIVVCPSHKKELGIYSGGK